MIQRIQTLWLFLAALVLSGVFYFNVYHIALEVPSQENYYHVTTIGNNYLAIVLAGGSIILSLVAIFFYKKRKAQINLIWLNILVNIGLLFWLFVGLNKFWGENTTVHGTLGIAMFLPLITIFLLFFALRGIRKDEKLIRSLDRLR